METQLMLAKDHLQLFGGSITQQFPPKKVKRTQTSPTQGLQNFQAQIKE